MVSDFFLESDEFEFGFEKNLESGELEFGLPNFKLVTTLT